MTDECIACHACCRYWRVEVTEADVIREPRLRDHIEKDEDDRWIISNRKSERCVFLGDDGRCEIYETRPTACRDFDVNSEMCQISRRFADLPEVVSLG